ncbi:hypothetical protein SAMN04487776_11342 [Priestia megaterium]|nr:hypothetical protein SAMN04487776_11342 [Priestia megaterium]
MILLSNRLQTIIILLGFVSIISALTFLKDFSYKQYLHYAGVLLMGFGFMYGSDNSDKESKKEVEKED